MTELQSHVNDELFTIRFPLLKSECVLLKSTPPSAVCSTLAATRLELSGVSLQAVDSVKALLEDKVQEVLAERQAVFDSQVLIGFQFFGDGKLPLFDVGSFECFCL